jgi:Protein of unknown function (DUF3225)
MLPMEINLPGPLAELTKAFREYQAALVSNRPDDLDRLFLNSPLTIRYGVAENLYGHADISAYRSRRARAGGAPRRKIMREVITTFGNGVLTTNIEYVREATGLAGRQSQAWIRTPDGWRIIAAHVSLIRDKD